MAKVQCLATSDSEIKAVIGMGHGLLMANLKWELPMPTGMRILVLIYRQGRTRLRIQIREPGHVTLILDGADLYGFGLSNFEFKVE